MNNNKKSQKRSQTYDIKYIERECCLKYTNVKYELREWKFKYPYLNFYTVYLSGEYLPLLEHF